MSSQTATLTAIETAEAAKPRRELDRPLTILQVHRNDPPTFFGYARNISSGGMRIDVTSPRDPGRRFRVRIPLPDPASAATECECEVVWNRVYSKDERRGPGMGLKFLDLPDHVADDLDAWVRRVEEYRGLISVPTD